MHRAPIAAVVADLVQSPESAAMILTLHVDPQWRDVGIGSLLLEDLCAHADEQDVRLIAQLPAPTAGADDHLLGAFLNTARW